MRAQTSADSWFTLNKIGLGVWAAVDNPKAKERSYANAGIIIGDDGVVVVDTLTGADAAGRLLQEARGSRRCPEVRVNTHYHSDHVAGNRIFADAGAHVMAHRNVRRWIHAENLRMLGDSPKPELKTFVEQLFAPTLSYTDAVDLHLGSRVVQVRSFPGIPVVIPLSSFPMRESCSPATSSGRPRFRIRSTARQGVDSDTRRSRQRLSRIYLCSRTR
jgi:hypothetical protein